MEISGIRLRNNLFVAPMAGVTDKPFRALCRKMGAGLAVGEMVSSNTQLYQSTKTLRRINHEGELAPVSVQIAGSDPQIMALAARHNVEHGAQMIDINMGCPVKKVCNVASGSALMRNEALAVKILEAVVQAVPEVPVSLKMRTGWDQSSKNALSLARLAESVGIRFLTIHGRTRNDFYTGSAEYDTIAQVKAAVGIPVIANGDIDSAHKARAVLDYTKADGVMVGRGAQGRPWIFREIEHFLAHGEILPAPTAQEVADICLEHLQAIYAFYGEQAGVRIARKHIAWYVKGIAGAHLFRAQVNLLESAQAQIEAVARFFKELDPTNPLSFDNIDESKQEIQAA